MQKKLYFIGLFKGKGWVAFESDRYVGEDYLINLPALAIAIGASKVDGPYPSYAEAKMLAARSGQYVRV